MRGNGLILLAALAAMASAGPSRAQAPPPNLPSYDLAIRLDTANKTVRLAERVTFTNRTTKPVHELVFCVYPLYEMPEKDLAVLAKTVGRAVEGAGRHDRARPLPGPGDRVVPPDGHHHRDRRSPAGPGRAGQLHDR
jgi:hypothetical protein